MVAGLALAGLALVRRRGRLALLALVACSFDGTTWDDAVDAGPTGDAAAFMDVFGAELGDGPQAQILLAHQALDPAAQQPTAVFALSRLASGRPLFRAGLRISTAHVAGAELLGWARGEAGEGTALLVELELADGALVYETDAVLVDDLVADGAIVTAELGYVWPPGHADVVVHELDTDNALVTPCSVSIHSATRSPLVLLYASPGKEETLRFLRGCPGEVVVGEKRKAGPVGSMKSAEAKAGGGRTAFVIDRNGDMLRELLSRPNGLERTIQYMKNKLASGYDYIVIDEITAHPDFRDGTTLNRRLRTLIARMPIRTIIPYISIDLTQYPSGFGDLKARRFLIRAFKRRARALALEVYLHTGQVMAGAAPAAFRRAADRLALAVAGMRYAGGINLRAITVIATSIHGGSANLPQYSYLDQKANDLASITRQVNAIRGGGKRLRQQNGVGYYFVNKSDMEPRAGGYSYDALIKRLRTQALRFK